MLLTVTAIHFHRLLIDRVSCIFISVDQIRDDIIVNKLDHWLKFPKGQLITKLIGTACIVI